MNTLRMESSKQKIFLIIKIFSYNKLHAYLCFEYQWRCYSKYFLNFSCKNPFSWAEVGCRGFWGVTRGAVILMWRFGQDHELELSRVKSMVCSTSQGGVSAAVPQGASLFQRGHRIPVELSSGEGLMGWLWGAVVPLLHTLHIPAGAGISSADGSTLVGPEPSRCCTWGRSWGMAVTGTRLSSLGGSCPRATAGSGDRDREGSPWLGLGAAAPGTGTQRGDITCQGCSAGLEPTGSRAGRCHTWRWAPGTTGCCKSTAWQILPPSHLQLFNPQPTVSLTQGFFSFRPVQTLS